MLDLVETFEWRGERRHLLFNYAALFQMEKDHGLPLGKAWSLLEQLSVTACAAALLCGLEAHRKAGSPAGTLGDRLRWTIDDAQQIVMDLGPVASIRVVTDALTKACIPPAKTDSGAPAGKAEAGSNGPPSN